MRRNATCVACALALAASAPDVSALDMTPYLEYEVHTWDSIPNAYYRDIKDAAVEVAERECQRLGYKGCTVARTWYFNSLYFVEFNYISGSGKPASGSVYNYHYLTCDMPTRLYLVSGTTRYGPYANRTMAPGPSWGKPVCHSDAAPDPDPVRGTEHQSDMGPGDCQTRPNVGNPINVGISNKYQEVVDIARTESSPLTWVRYYNSGVVNDRPDSGSTYPDTSRLGSRWRATYDRSIVIERGKAGDVVRLHRHTGERLDFSPTGDSYRSSVDPRGQLSRAGDGWAYRAASGETELYDATGRLVAMDIGTSREVRLRYSDSLLEIADLQGRRLTLSYDAAGRIGAVTDGIGAAVTYSYSEKSDSGLNADLASATYADGSTQFYFYDEPSFNGGTSHPHALTGIKDETGQRFASFWYDGAGRAIHSEHAGGADSYHLIRAGDGSVAVTGPTNAVHTYRFAEVKGSRRLVGMDQPGGAGCGAAYSKIEYDDNGLISRRVDFDGRVSEYRYDSEGNEVERTEAAGTSVARKVTTEWHPVLARPVRITSPGREERYSYDGHGNTTERQTWGAIDPAQLAAPLTLSRIWRTTYDAQGRPETEEGPRSDLGKVGLLRRYTYRSSDATNCANAGACDYRKGDLWKTTDAIGHVEETLSYDAAGRVRSRRDPQGSIFTYVYSKRGWLTESHETRPDGTSATILIAYTARGDIESITDADGIKLRFDYDGAGRLTMVSNPSNHRLIFKLDASGRRIVEEAYDSMFLKTQLKRSFDALGRVETVTDGEGAVTRYSYDEMGRPTGMTDADGRRDVSSYDPLGRLREAIGDVAGRGASTRAAYDPLDQLTALEDAKGVTTHYLTTGLGDLGSVDSPDGGESTDEHDVAGMLIRHVGPDGVGSYQVTRDALGRPSVVTYADPGLEKRFVYDNADPLCTAGERSAIGRLVSMTQGSSHTVYCYDAPGNVTRKIQRSGTTSRSVSYTYSPAGRLTGVAVDGGARITYGYDMDGSVTSVKVEPVGGPVTDLITAVTYRPFDAVESVRYGNGRQITSSRDKAGRIIQWGGIDPGNSIYALGYTAAGQPSTLTARAYEYTLGYDGLGYLTSVVDARSGATRSYGYDLTGDRRSEVADGLHKDYLYDSSSHRLTSEGGKHRRYDAAGNTIAIGDATLSYDAEARLMSASEQGRPLVTYGYDADGLRIMRKEASGSPALLMLYDEDDQWLADYDEGGHVSRQAVWLDGYLVGLVDRGSLLYVEPDHLGTPRAIVDPRRAVTVWRWRQDDQPFGASLPDEDPDADGTPFVFDLRLPGQRYDALTGLYANGRRDYDATTGRYIQADPIGLNGGINPYLYAFGSPFHFTDPEGLSPPGRVPSAHSWKQGPGRGGVYGQGVKFMPPRPSTGVEDTPGAWPSGTGRRVNDPRYELVCTRGTCFNDVMACTRTNEIWRLISSHDISQSIVLTKDVPANCTCRSIDFLDHVLEDRARGAVSMPDGNAFDAIEIADKLLRIRPFRGARR